ncbi:MAG: hypothetical protein IKT93_05590 [Clostridia bacterium]|nr:hypothetical protein [Clostridia bacterium]
MKGTKIIRGIAISIIAIFVIHQAFSAIYNPIKTENAVFYTATDGLKITGLIIRNETLVVNDNSGVLHFVIGDGGRVSKDGVIANVYSNESSSITLSRINTLNEKIKDIEDILSYNDVDAVNLDLINSKFEDKVNETILAASTFNYSDFLKSSEALLSVVNRKQAALGVEIDLSSQLQSLKTELESLNSHLPNAKASINAEKSGYFVSKTDGYEHIFSNLNADDITCEFLSNATSKENKGNIIGKIVSDYEWCIAAEVSVDESLNFKEGESLILETPIKTSPKLPVTVKQINISESLEKAVILFSCNQMNSELAVTRSSPMTVIKSEYSGLKVPKKALRVVNSVRGVYVETGMQVEFVPVNIIYTGKDFIICEKQTENGNVLKLYDRVVVKGKNLYDGKIIG